MCYFFLLKLVNGLLFYHEDGPLYNPTVSTISLGSHTLLDFYKPISQIKAPSDLADSEPVNFSLDDRYMFSLCLEPRSLVILKEDMYKVYLHGIKEVNKDVINSNLVANFDQLDKSVVDLTPSFILNRQTRVSITIRSVVNVVNSSKLNSLLFSKKKIL